MVERIWLAGARADYGEAYEWYCRRSETAAAGFEAAVEGGLEAIANNPELWPLVDDRHRFYLLDRYPYLIIFRTDPDNLIVVAIAHARRDPSFWQERDRNGPDRKGG